MEWSFEFEKGEGGEPNSNGGGREPNSNGGGGENLIVKRHIHGICSLPQTGVEDLRL